LIVQNDATPTKPSARKGGIRGRYAVLATLALAILVPTIAVLIAPMLSGNNAPLKLDYNERGSWFMMPVRARPLEYDTFVAAETGKQYKRTDLTIDPDVEQVLHRCAQLAQRDDFFENTQSRDQLITLAGDPDNGFYPAYLLASWYEVNGDSAAHLQWIRTAYDRAGGALAQRLVDDDGRPVAGYLLPPVAIGYDRVIDGERDASLVLIYPAPISEPNGFVYLPTYRSIYRLTDADQPLGMEPGVHPIGLTLLPQAAMGTKPNWFAVPDGAVGQMDDAVVDRQNPAD